MNFSFLVISSVIICCHCVHSYLNDVDLDETKQGISDMPNEETEEVEPFIATNEWQRVKPGQAVPSGLHIKMDMTNGGKWAKLMESEKDSGLAIVSDQKQSDDHEIENKASYDLDELKSALKKLKDKRGKNTTSIHENEIKSKFRSIEEIRETFDQLNLQEESDVEVMKKLLIIIADKDSEMEKKQLALQDLEYYVHQIDNANDFVKLDGFSVVIPALNSSDVVVREEAAHVIGSAVQSNPKVQIQAIQSGVLGILLTKLKTKQEKLAVRKKCLFAISSLVRHFPVAQSKLYVFGGFDIMIKLFEEEGTQSLQLKTIRLINDLVEERKYAAMTNDEDKKERIKQLNRLNLDDIIKRQGWCSVIASTLRAEAHTEREVVLEAMKNLFNNCKEEFQKSAVVSELEKLKGEYETLSKEEADEGEKDGYFGSMLHLTNEVLEMVKVYVNTKSEL